MQEKFWFLKNCRLFEQLEPLQLRWLESRSRMRRFAKSSTVYLPADQSDGVLLLAEGRVKICSVTPDGKQTILTFVEPGDVFGELALFDNGDREEFARATDNSMVVLMPADALRKVAEENPYLAMGITRLVGLRRKRVERRLKYLLFRPNRERLVHLLMELAEDYGKVNGSEIEIGIKLSHQDLASVIGSTRESVTLILGQMQSEGLVKIGRRKVVLCKMAELAKSVSIAPPDLTEAAKAAWGQPPRVVGNNA